MHRGNATKAYFDAYGDMKQSSARANASRLLTKANIQKRILELTERGGLLESTVESIKQLSDATKTIVRRGKVAAVVPDNLARLKAIQICLKINGVLC